MTIKSYISNRLLGGVSKKLTAKQLAASRRNIQKAIAARARATGTSVVKTAKNPVRAYAGSVVKKTNTKRLNKMSRVSKKLARTKSSNSILKSRLETATSNSRIATGKLAKEQSRFSLFDKSFKVNKLASKAEIAQRKTQIADRILAVNEKQTKRLTNTYAKLSKDASGISYASTVAIDVASIAVGGIAGYLAYEKVKAMDDVNKKK